MSQNIYAKLFNVQASCNALKRDTKGGSGKFTFKYASLAEVQGEVNKYLAENKILLNFEFFNAELIGELIKVECRAKFINVENIEEVVLVVFPFLIDHNKSLNIVQCIGAAQTYARRYFLQNYFNLVTKEALDEDPDQYQKFAETKKMEQSPTNDSKKINARDLVTSYFQDSQLKNRWFELLKEHESFIEFGYKWSKYPREDLKIMFKKMEEFQVKIKTPPKTKGVSNAELAVSPAAVSTSSAPENKLGEPTEESFGEKSEEEVNWDDNF